MENDIRKDIGARLAEVRRKNKMTQEALADKLGVSPKHISHVENATSSVSLKSLIHICTIFNCSLDYIIFGNQSNKMLSKLPVEIVKILNSGNATELDRLKRYLEIFVELNNKCN